MKKKSLKVFFAIALFTQLGLSMAIPIMAGIMIGDYLDKKQDTNGIFLIIFLLLGIFAGFLGSYRLIKMVNDRKDKED